MSTEAADRCADLRLFSESLWITILQSPSRDEDPERLSTNSPLPLVETCSNIFDSQPCGPPEQSPVAREHHQAQRPWWPDGSLALPAIASRVGTCAGHIWPLPVSFSLWLSSDICSGLPLSLSSEPSFYPIPALFYISCVYQNSFQFLSHLLFYLPLDSELIDVSFVICRLANQILTKPS